jgi:hypothetical protein
MERKIRPKKNTANEDARMSAFSFAPSRPGRLRPHTPGCQWKGFSSSYSIRFDVGMFSLRMPTYQGL